MDFARLKAICNYLSSRSWLRHQTTQAAPIETGRPWRRELDALVEVSGILTRPIDFDRKCDLMLAVLARTAGADRASLRTMDQAGTGLRLLASYSSGNNVTGRYPEVTMPLSRVDYPSVQSFLNRTVLVIADCSKLKNPLPDYHSPLSHSLLICPVQAGERVVGVLGFNSLAINNFNPETVQLMTAIASTIGVLIENASLQEERMLGDEKTVRLAQALEFTDDAIALVDEQGGRPQRPESRHSWDGLAPRGLCCP